MLPRYFSVRMFCVFTMASAGAVCGQNYPTKPVRIVTAGVGGGNDFVARLIAQGLTGPLGQPVVVENRGGGVIPGEVVAKSPPDGHTLLVMSGSLWLGQFLRSSVPYDVVKDFLPITLADRAPNVLVVHPSLPVRNVKELIALAKARPGALNYSSAAIGASSHLAGELFKVMAGVNIVNIPYKSGAAETNDLIAGQVQLAFGTAATVNPHIKSGRIRALAVTSLQPSELAPGLPTVASSGLPGYESVSLHAVFAPAKTPASIVNRLNQEIVRFLKTSQAREPLLNAGVEPVGSTAQELDATVKSEMNRLGKMIRDAGIREQ